MSQDIRAVIFDVDGTLVDSVDLHARAWADVFEEFGHPVAFDAVRRQIGKGGDQLLPVFLDAGQIARQGEAIEKRRGELLRERYLGKIVPFPKVRDLFERILADGKQVALASSAKNDELEHYKRLVHIDDLIDTQTSSQDAEKSKPEPDIFEAALERLGAGIEAACAVVIGDTPYDAQAAARAGVRSIGMLCGGWSGEELRRAGCMAVYRDPAHLLAEYDDSPLAAG